MNSGRGRPATHVVNRLRVMLWSHLIQMDLEATSLQEMEEALQDQHGIRLASGLWSRYMRGEVTPQGSLAGAANSLVLRLNKVRPGTAAVFYHPLWNYVEWNPLIDLRAIRRDYLQLGDDVAVRFVRRVQLGRERAFPKSDAFWHMPKTIEARQSSINSFKIWNALAAYLMEARLAYAAQQIEAYIHSQSMAIKIIAMLRDKPILNHPMPCIALLVMEALCLQGLWLHEDGRPDPGLESHFEHQDGRRNARKLWEINIEQIRESLNDRDRRLLERRLGEISSMVELG